ncbi:MAG: RNA 2',3'-cyclic phosphodiesterase, partial [Myxococcota bacterium]
MSDGTSSDSLVLSEPADSGILRVFFAVELGERARSAASRSARGLQDAPNGHAVRWVRAESFHVTLRFIGDVERVRIRALSDCVRVQTAALRPFRLELGGVRPFPSRHRPGFMVLDVGPVEQLEELAEAVERGVEMAGFAPELRPFRPHLTLGRIRGKKFPAVTGNVTVVGEGCVVSDAVLFKSDLHPSGAQYTPIERIPIGGLSNGPQAWLQRKEPGRKEPGRKEL